MRSGVLLLVVVAGAPPGEPQPRQNQRLSLNPSQISGGCGRLLCCLRYEHDFYIASRKRFPKEGNTVLTANGRERVQSVDIFRERVLLRSEDNTLRILMLSELKEEVAAQPQPTPGPEEPKVPAALATFDEGPTQLTEEDAAAAVTPTPQRRRKRRRGRGRQQKKDTNEGDQGGN